MAGGPSSYSGKRQMAFKTLHALAKAELPRWRVVARSVAEAGEADDFVASFLEQLVEAVVPGGGRCVTWTKSPGCLSTV
jgi:hypothetical protein